MEDTKPPETRRIELLRETPIEKRTHAKGDVIECDKVRAKYLIDKEQAVETDKELTSLEPQADPEKRDASANPQARKAVKAP